MLLSYLGKLLARKRIIACTGLGGELNQDLRFRLDSTLEERRAGAALLRSCFRILCALAAFQEEISKKEEQSAVPHRAGLQSWLRAGLLHELAYADRFTDMEEIIKCPVMYSVHDSILQRKVVIKFVEHYSM